MRRVGRNASGAAFAFATVADLTTRLNLVVTAADLKGRGDYVTTTADFNATMSQSGASATVAPGSQISGSLTESGAADVER